MISVEMMGKIRRMYFRDKLSLHQIAKRTGLSRMPNYFFTLADWSTIQSRMCPGTMSLYRARELPV